MEINWTKATQAMHTTGASRHRRPTTARLARAGTHTRAIPHDRRGRDDGEVIAQRARAFAKGVPGTSGPANAGWVRNGPRDAETALTVARSFGGPEVLPPVDDHPAEPVAKRTEGTDRDAIPLVARGCVKDRDRSRDQDRIAAGRQRHGELAGV